MKKLLGFMKTNRNQMHGNGKRVKTGNLYDLCCLLGNVPHVMKISSIPIRDKLSTKGELTLQLYYQKSVQRKN